MSDRPNDEYEATSDYKGSYGGGGSSYGGGGGGGGGAYPGEYRSMGSPQPRQPTASDYKSPGEYRSMGSPQPMQSTMFASGMQQGINNSGSYMNGVVPAFQNINFSPGQQQVMMQPVMTMQQQPMTMQVMSVQPVKVEQMAPIRVEQIAPIRWEVMPQPLPPPSPPPQQIQYVDKIVEVPVEVKQYVQVEVPVEVTKTVEVPKYVDKKVKKYRDIPYEVEKRVEVPVPYERIVHVEVPVEKIVYRDYPVPVHSGEERVVTKEIQVPVEVVREVPVPVENIVYKEVQVPVEIGLRYETRVGEGRAVAYETRRSEMTVEHKQSPLSMHQYSRENNLSRVSAAAVSSPNYGASNIVSPGKIQEIGTVRWENGNVTNAGSRSPSHTFSQPQTSYAGATTSYAASFSSPHGAATAARFSPMAGAMSSPLDGSRSENTSENTGRIAIGGGGIEAAIPPASPKPHP